MRSKRTTLLVVGLTALVACSAWLATSGAADGRADRRASVGDGAARDVAAPVAATSSAAARSATASEGPASAPPATSGGLASKVDRWSHSPDPVDAMRAYRAVFDCLQARRDDRRPSEEIALEKRQMLEALPEEQRARLRASFKSSATQCGDLRSDQVQERLQWLARAAKAGVPMAALDFILEEPDGDGLLQDFPVPASVPTQAWMDQRDAYVDIALRHCDMMLVGYLSAHARGDPADELRALDFWQARASCGGTGRPPLTEDVVARGYLAGMSPPAPASAGQSGG